MLASATVLAQTASTVPNGAFEAPALTGASKTVWAPAGSGVNWTFSTGNSAGINRNDGTAPALHPEGVQAAVLSNGGQISQYLSFSSTGSHQIRFRALRKQGHGTNIQVLFNGVQVGSNIPITSNTAYGVYTSASFNPPIVSGPAISGTIALRAVLAGASGGNLAFVDLVELLAPANTPPALTIAAPANNAILASPANVTVTANASDSDGAVASVKFLKNGAQFGTLLTSTNCGANCYASPPVALSQGQHSLSAIATDAGGAATQAAPVTVTIDPGVFAAGGRVLDIDLDGQVNSATDGSLIFNYLAGTTVVNGNLGAGAQRTDPALIANYLNTISSRLDIDGNGVVDVGTDALLIQRFMAGMRGASLTQGALGSGAIRTSPAQVEAWLGDLMLVDVVNPGFEWPRYAGLNNPGPDTAFWQFNGTVNTQGNGSGVTALAAPEGVQTGVLWGGAVRGAAMQDLVFPGTGSYQIRFLAARNNTNPQSIRFYVDNVPVGADIPVNGNAAFATYTSAIFALNTAGTHRLRWANTSASGSDSILLDDVHIVPNNGPAVELVASATALTAPGTLILTADVADYDRGLLKVEFVRDGIVFSTWTAPPNTTTAQPTAPDSNLAARGTPYVYTARAYAVGGALVTTSTPVHVTVSNAQYTLAITRNGPGAGTITGSAGSLNCGATCSASYAAGAVVTLTATAAGGSVFGGWGGACAGTGPTCTLTMTKAMAVTGTFNISQYALAVTKAGAGNGTVASNPAGISCGATCSASFNTGTSVILSATPAAGSAFAGWSGACSGTGNCTVTMSQAQAATASFATGYVLTVSAAGGGAITSNVGGIDCGGAGAVCSRTFLPGAMVTLTATPGAGSVFGSWSGICANAGSAPTCTVTMNQAQSATASFRNVLTITSAGTAGGSVRDTAVSQGQFSGCIAQCSWAYVPGTSVTLAAQPTTAYTVFAGWSGACTGQATTCTVVLNQAASVTATFTFTPPSAPTSGQVLDVDLDGQAGAATDGTLISRYLFGSTGTALTFNALGAGARRTDPNLVVGYLDTIRPRLDVDGDGQVQALTDGLLIQRYLQGTRGAALTSNVVGSGATR
ncbi:MAG: Ig-like domain-containing protein, partial [Betaproteobacteria bacterium]